MESSLLYEHELGREYRFDGKIIRLRVDRVSLPNGKEAVREVVEHDGAVAILPVDAHKHVYLVKQFRKPVESVVSEAPAGKLEKSETPIEGAKRELREETGLFGGTIFELGYIFTTPGFCDERIHLFLVCEPDSGSNDPDQDEFLNVERIPWKDFLVDCREGKIIDSKTLALAFRAETKVEAYFSDKQYR
jgi:ADP-ribose pyrophosphatase